MHIIVPQRDDPVTTHLFRTGNKGAKRDQMRRGGGTRDGAWTGARGAGAKAWADGPEGLSRACHGEAAADGEPRGRQGRAGPGTKGGQRAVG